ncbi:hypothetical protein CL657_03185 [bacterium]|nr:hypothetical protein [bacterium]|tara:strand:- start:273 stop:497 length:225 start_codon:yes stop_codon:yes gene_type:complete
MNLSESSGSANHRIFYFDEEYAELSKSDSPKNLKKRPSGTHWVTYNSSSESISLEDNPASGPNITTSQSVVPSS